MAITGTFLADFSSFTSAVQRADVELRGMETSAGRVGQSLNRMVDNFSGRKIVQDATLAAEAVERIGGTSRLTENELRRVGATAQEAADKLRALGQDVPPGIQNIADAAARLKTETEQGAKAQTTFADTFKSTVAGFVTAQAIIGALRTAWRTLTDFVGSSVTAFAAQETATRRMTAALEAQGTATPHVIKQYQELSAQFQKTTVFGDELIQEMQALLVQIGNVMPRDMDRALRAATDLASGLGVDLRTATMLVGKAFAGETGTLKRYGIVVDEAKLKAEGITAVLDAIHARFGGQAQAEIETYAGKVKQLENAWGDLKEEVGRVIVQDEFLRAAMRSVTEQITGVNDAASGGTSTLTDWWIALSGVRLTPEMQIALAMMKTWAHQSNEIAAQMRAMRVDVLRPENIPAPFRGSDFGQDLTAANQRARDLLAQWTEEQKKATEAQKQAAAEAKKAAAEAQRVADTTQKQIDALIGLDAITKALNTAQLVSIAQSEQGYVIAQMTVAQQRAIRDTMQQALDTYRRLGMEVPPHIQALADETRHVGIVTDQTWKSVGIFRAELERLAGRPVEAVEEVTAVIGLTKKQIELAVDGVMQFRESLDDAGTNSGKAFRAGLMADMEKIPALLAQGFASGGSLGNAVISIFALLGSQAGKAMGEKIGASLSDGAKKWGGLIGGALGSLAGGAVGWLYDKMFGTTDYEKRVRANAAAVAELRQQVELTAGGMDALRTRASIVGIQIDEAFRSRDAAWIEKVLGDVEDRTNRLTAAMEKYGISWEELGELARQSKINEMAKELLLDFEILMTAGADLDFIIGKMGDHILEFLAAAQRTGAEVPIAMKPMLQRMLDMGLLVDENGNAFESLEDSGIKFAETMTQGFDRIVEAINRIAAALGYVFDEFDNRAINIPVNTGSLPSPGRSHPDSGSGEPEIHAASGYHGWVHKPTRFLAGEAGSERVDITPGGGGGNVVTVVQLDGRTVAELVAPYIPGSARRYVRA
jgi:hypothetical protein